MKGFFILITLLIIIDCFAQTTSNIENLQQIYYSVEYAQKLSVVNIVLGFLSLLCGVFLVTTYLFCKEGRNTPGDLVFCIGWISIMMSIYWIGCSIFSLLNKNNSYIEQTQLTPSKTCNFFSFIDTWAYSSLYVYNFAYCVSLRYKIQHVLKDNKKRRLIVTQVVCFVTSLVPPVFFSSLGQNKVSELGMCVAQINIGEVVMGIILLFSYFLNCVYTVWFSYKNIPNNDDIKELKKKILLRQVIYIISTAVLFLILSISTLFFGTQSYEFKKAFTWTVITNIAFLSIPFALAFLRYTNPIIQIKVNYFIKRALFLKPDESCYEETLQDLQKDGESDQKLLQKKIKENQIKAILLGILQYYTNLNRLDQIRSNLKEDVNVLTYSEENFARLDAMELPPNQQPLINNESDVEIQPQTRGSNLKQFLKTLGITNQILNQEFQFHVDTNPLKDNRELTKQEKKKRNEILKENPKMSILSPIYFETLIFQKLLELDAIEINNASSFNIESNEETIMNYVGPDGGKSGEFFFFTYDNKWVLKTITPEELRVFRRMMPQYLEHMYHNRDTFINKIYGVFSLNLNQMTVKYSRKDLNVLHFILQRNISYIGGKYIRRTFDLKGSQDNREVLPEDENERIKVLSENKKTLKDIDFTKTENTIRIADKNIDEIRKQLKRDSEFFKCQNVMDYSLLVMKVSWGEYFIDYPSSEKDIMEKLAYGRFGILREEPQTPDLRYYHIAIIDYLQLWNSQKIIENNAKKMIKMDRSLDVSAVDPNFYSKRFIENVVKKFFQIKTQEDSMVAIKNSYQDITIN